MVTKVLVLALLASVALAVNPDLEDQELAGQKYVSDLEADILARNNEATEASWAYESDISEAHLKARDEIQVRNANYFKEVARELRKYDWQNFKNGDLKRMFKKMTDLGYAALPEAKFTELLDAISSMSENYATAKVCDYKNREKCDLALEPELTEIFATSRDPEELKYYWTQWYDKAGTPTREAFDKYIKLSNEAAKLNSKIGVPQNPDSQKSSSLLFRPLIRCGSLAGRVRGRNLRTASGRRH